MTAHHKKGRGMASLLFYGAAGLSGKKRGRSRKHPGRVFQEKYFVYKKQRPLQWFCLSVTIS